MSLGLGLFLGMFFCGIILLYTQTKDRWNWGKSRRFILYLIGIPIALVASYFGSMYLYEEYQHRPVVISNLVGFELGEKFQDIIFKHGEPNDTTEEAEFAARWIVENSDKKGTKKFESIAELYKLLRPKKAGIIDGIYLFKSNQLTIKNNVLELINYKCNSDSFDKTNLNGINCGSTGEEILNKFGSSVRILCSTSGEKLQRVYDVVKYGTRYYLSGNLVTNLGIAVPATLKTYEGKAWGKCS